MSNHADRMEALRLQIVRSIATDGFFSMAVFGTREEPRPPFLYTIGMPGGTEFLMIGLPHATMHTFMHTVYNEMQTAGRTFAPGYAYDEIAEGFPLYFGRVVEAQYYGDYVGWAIDYHGGQPFPVVQLVWTDTQGRFPWQTGFEERFRDKQPILFTPPGAGDVPTEKEIV